MNRTILALALSPLLAATARAEPGESPSTRPATVVAAATATPEKTGGASASTGGTGSTVETSFSDGKHQASIKYGTDGGKTLTVKDLQGKELFKGPVNTDDQRNAVPEDLQPLLDAMERQTKVTASSSSESSFSDGQHQVSVKQGPDGGKTLTVRDSRGTQLFSGPIDTDEQKAAVPADLRPLLEKVEKMNTTAAGATTETKASDPGR